MKINLNLFSHGRAKSFPSMDLLPMKSWQCWRQSPQYCRAGWQWLWAPGLLGAVAMEESPAPCDGHHGRVGWTTAGYTVSSWGLPKQIASLTSRPVPQKCCNVCVHGCVHGLYPPVSCWKLSVLPYHPDMAYSSSFPHQLSMDKNANPKTHMRVGKDGDEQSCLPAGMNMPHRVSSGSWQQQVLLALHPCTTPGNAKWINWISTDWECNFLSIQSSHLPLPCSFSCCYRSSSLGYI